MTKTIKIFGDEYRIRKTYDIDDSGIGIYGYEVYENKKFLKYFGGIEDLKTLKNYIKVNFYKKYDQCHKKN